MKCKRCGEMNPSNSDYCPNCQMLENTVPEDSRIEKESQTNNIEIDKKIENDKPEKKEEPLIYIIAFVINIISLFIKELVLYDGFYDFSSFIIVFLLSNPINLLIALIIVIIGKIKCPKNKTIKVLFWITIILTIAYITLIVFLLCACSSMDRSSFG